MLDGFVKQCGPYGLCAAQSVATLAYAWHRGQTQDYQTANADFQAAVIYCVSSAWLLRTICEASKTRKNLKESQELIEKVVRMLGQPTRNAQLLSYPSPFSIQALSSTFVAAVSLIYEEKTPGNIVLIACSAIIAVMSLYNRVYHNYEGASK